MTAAAKASGLGPRQCGTDSRKKRFAQKKGVRDETKHAARTGTSYDPEPISGEATPERAKGKKLKGERPSRNPPTSLGGYLEPA